MQSFSVLYSYPTWDPYYRGQRGTVVTARDEAHALSLIWRDVPGAEIVRIKVKGSRS